MTNVVPLRRAVAGATPEEWAHFSLVVGASDLLPVVSEPTAVISEASTMKGLGKTPSLYNAQRRVVGIPKWTAKRSTAEEIARWALEGDYGLCIQTRRVRGLDIDIPDPALADRVEAAFCAALAMGLSALPGRTRAGTGKRLLAFELVGSFAKRSFKVAGGLVEFLADGQQFIALGLHTSGTRYEWPDGLPVFPVVTQAAFETAWQAIVEEFALEGAAEGGAGLGRDRADLDGVDDPVVDFIAEHNLALGYQGEKVFVDCPWKAGHSSDSGVSETAWLVAGTKGFERGHFQCLHASCTARTDTDFLDEIGFRVAAFTNLDEAQAQVEEGEGGPAQAGLDGETVYPPWPKFKRDGKGAIEATLANVELALSRPDICELTVRYDTFRDTLLADGRPFKDADAVGLRIVLERRGFKPVGREMMRDALLRHAEDNQFDSAQDWLASLPAWDGVERVETFFPRLFAVGDTPYTRAVGRYTWTALAGRVLQPGCKVDMVPILQGAQGQMKSTAVAALAPPGAFRELNLHDLGNPDLSRRLRGCIVGELAELRGLKTRDAESIKAWIVQQEERWVPKFVERETVYSRRCVLLATTNPAGVLDDETGERRWLPMEVGGMIDAAGVAAERDQLWAEGALRWQALGVEWQDAERLARAEHGKFKVRDERTVVVEKWLDQAADVSGETYNSRGWVHLSDVAEGVLGVRGTAFDMGAQRALGKIMRGLGWSAGAHRTDDGVVWCWVRGDVRGM